MQKGTAYWQKHVAAIEREGLSTSAYAKQHGLAVNRLYYWQRKAAGFAVPGTTKEAAPFIALRVASTVSASTTHCTLILPSGLRLEMAALPAPAWLAALSYASQGEH